MMYAVRDTKKKQLALVGATYPLLVMYIKKCSVDEKKQEERAFSCPRLFGQEAQLLSHRVLYSVCRMTISSART